MICFARISRIDSAVLSKQWIHLINPTQPNPPSSRFEPFQQPFWIMKQIRNEDRK